MNPTTTLIQKSHPVGRPIAGLQFRIHRTCWLLLPLLVLLPPGPAPSGLRARSVATLVGLAILGLAVCIQVAVSVFLARRQGARPAVVLLFPFGPLIWDGLTSLATGAKLWVWLAGPSVNIVGGWMLASWGTPALGDCGRLMSAFGLFSLAPCYPLPGGLIARELLGLAGGDDADSDRRTLETSRVGLCVLGCQAVLSLSLPWLYILFVLWVITHLALIPGIDLAGIHAASIRWFQDRWTWLKQQFSRLVTVIFAVMIWWSCTPGLVHAGSPREFKRPPETSGPPASSVGLLETNLLELAARLARLERSVEETTGRITILASTQQRIELEGAGTTARLKATEATLTSTAQAMAEEIDRGRRTSALALQELARAQQQLDTAHRQLPPRVGAVEAALAQLQRKIQSVASNSESRMRYRQATANRTDKALAVRDENAWCAIAVLTALGVISIAALGVAASSLHRRIQRVTSWLGNRGVNPSFGAASTKQGPPCPPVVHQTSGLEPGNPTFDQAAGVSGSSRAPIISEANCLADSSSHPQAVATASPIPPTPGKAILARHVPEPAELLRRLLHLAQRHRGIRAKPTPGQAGPWTIGCVTSRGPVRSKNEDYALAFEIAGCQVVLVADGVSGEPLAGLASFLAVQNAAWWAMKQLGAMRAWQHPDPMHVASQALQAAATGLGRIATRNGCVTGLKTTLIVVVAARKIYGYAYIGDGQGCVLRATGAQEQFLVPQRAATDPACVIAACLGPTLLGHPVSGTLPRRPGDLLIVGTDGAFSESVELGPDYMKRLLRVAIHFRGDLQRTAGHVLQELGSIQDQFGFMFDDNLTLTLVGDGKPPRLQAGFWSAKDPPGNPPEREVMGLAGVEPLLPAATPLPTSDGLQSLVRRQP